MQLGEESSPLVTSWTLVSIPSHFGSSVLLGSTQHLATHVHDQVPKLQMLKEGDHVKVLRNAFSHHGIAVVPGELAIDFVAFLWRSDMDSNRSPRHHCTHSCWV